MELREAGPDDIDRLLPLFLDMERFYDGDRAIDAATGRERLQIALAAHPRRIFLAAFDGDAVGFVTLYEMFPSVALRAMWYMKELYVAGHARGRAVGEALLRAAAQAVMARGGERIEFTTDRANKGAQKFYDRLLAAEAPKVFYRFEGDALARLADASMEPPPGSS